MPPFDGDEEIDRGDDLTAGQIAAAKAAEEEETAAKLKEEEDAKAKEETDAEAKAKEEEEAAAAKEEEDAKAKDNIQIPKRRYDVKARQLEEERQRNEALEKKLAKLEDNDPLPESVEEVNAAMAALDTKLEAARADGDADAVARLAAEQRTIQNKFFMNQLNKKSESDVAAATHASKLDMMVTELEEAYEILNPESEEYDETVVDEINELSEALELKGYSPPDALTRSVNLIMKDVVKAKVVDIDDKRKTDVKKNVDAAKRMPPDLEDSGKDSDKQGLSDEIDAGKLTEDEFEKLPEEAKKRLRGDFM